MYKVIFILGDGIGLEVVKVMKKVVEVIGVEIEWEEVNVGEVVIEEYGILFFEYIIDSIKKNKIVIKGLIIIFVGKGFRSVNVILR